MNRLRNRDRIARLLYCTPDVWLQVWRRVFGDRAIIVHAPIRYAAGPPNGERIFTVCVLIGVFVVLPVMMGVVGARLSVSAVQTLWEEVPPFFGTERSAVALEVPSRWPQEDRAKIRVGDDPTTRTLRMVPIGEDGLLTDLVSAARLKPGDTVTVHEHPFRAGEYWVPLVPILSLFGLLAGVGMLAFAIHILRYHPKYFFRSGSSTTDLSDRQNLALDSLPWSEQVVLESDSLKSAGLFLPPFLGAFSGMLFGGIITVLGVPADNLGPTLAPIIAGLLLPSAIHAACRAQYRQSVIARLEAELSTPTPRPGDALTLRIGIAPPAHPKPKRPEVEASLLCRRTRGNFPWPMPGEVIARVPFEVGEFVAVAAKRQPHDKIAPITREVSARLAIPADALPTDPDPDGGVGWYVEIRLRVPGRVIAYTEPVIMLPKPE